MIPVPKNSVKDPLLWVVAVHIFHIYISMGLYYMVCHNKMKLFYNIIWQGSDGCECNILQNSFKR